MAMATGGVRQGGEPPVAKPDDLAHMKGWAAAIDAMA
jgi:hypothetical protein